MKDPDEFDQYYKDVRTRLLVLTYCLTGDLPASRGAVRDAFVVTWHHWAKVSRLEDPEAWTRVRACSHAQRRHTAKLWHREKGLDPDVKATLDALGKLPVAQRRMLLLTELTTASLAEIAREVGLPRTDAERELQTATAQFAMAREVPTTSIRTVFDPVREYIEDNRWPRPTIIRRAGAARRRTHTVIGVGATVAVLVVTGTLVTDAAGVRPTLSRERMSDHGAANHTRNAPEPVELPEDAMLPVEDVARLVPGNGWTVTDTDDNTGGDGLVVPCQESRYADPGGAAALVRTFDTTGAKAPATVTQTAEVSTSDRAAKRGFNTTVDWFAGCPDDRAQLLETHAVDGVGDDAMLLLLRTWDEPGSVVVAGVARTGLITTSTVTQSRVGKEPKQQAVADLLAEAVDGLCEQPDGGTCATVARLRAVPPVPVAPVPAMLAEVDLPPVAGIAKPWVGTEPQQARTNAAATICDGADFSGGSMSNNVTRTFLIPDAKLADQFGLTETVGSLPEKKAKEFVANVRNRLAACADSDKHLGTDIERVLHSAGQRYDITVWHLTTEVTDDTSVQFLMGIVRDGTSIAQVGFVPDGKATISNDAFDALVKRALARLDAMPKPRTG
ncbi:hypothetical protein [Nocardioides sp. SR21]|uniref:hypothetical protein n=1 Tax=Nocardioides sp. SR21 TaxID=2919501 RepID=UPI001FAA8639|nr:hypothetical protein [Nocardioides sp. SR21]